MPAHGTMQMTRARPLVILIVAGVHTLALGCDLVVDTSTRAGPLALQDEVCSSNSDCRTESVDRYCANGRCIDDPISTECPEIWPRGALQQNGGNKLLIGFLGALGSGVPAADAGPAPAGYGRPPLEGVKLALSEIESNNSGLPGAQSEGQRHLAMLICNEEQGNAAASAEHLVHSALVPLVIGASFSGNTLRVFDQVTKNAGVLLLSPSATSPTLSERTRHDSSDDDPDDLLWRTS